MWPFSDSSPEVSLDEAGSPLGTTPLPTYDYIIVGAGTAGCVLASRLSEDPSLTILVVERGNVADTWASRVPLISGNLFRKGTQAVRWPAMPMKHVDGRVLEVVAGEGVGGGSRINSMVVTRGSPGDYNSWRDMGHPQWSYDALEPYFVKSETTLGQPRSSFRGTRGPWYNRTFLEPPYEIIKCVEQACNIVGIPSVSDINSPHAPAAGYATLDVATDTQMYRASTFRAFLPPALLRQRQQRLKLCTNALVTKVITKTTEDGTITATGIEFEGAKWKTGAFRVTARREVIVCSGAIGSAHILLLSGIGPRQHLESKDIQVVRDTPGVGRNLQDHIGLPVMYEVPISDTLHLMEETIWPPIRELLKYLFTGQGIFGMSFMQTSIFVPSHLLNDRSEIVSPDPQNMDSSIPRNVADVEIMPIAHNCSDILIKGKGLFSFLTALVKPKSVGSVRLTSNDPRARPEVDLGFLSNPQDYIVLRKAVKLALRLAEKVAGQGYPLKPYQIPETESDEDLDRFIRANLRTSYHYSSTCRMGKESDPEETPGVVDQELRVHGVRGLRVCDASVFPEGIATHTMAPVVAVAEKCADLLRGLV